MRYQRLILEAGDSAVTLPFHPRLSIIAGLGHAERQSLISEVTGALAGGRAGVHVEVVDDNGRDLALLRGGADGGDHVLDIQAAADVTEEFLDESGKVSLLHRFGIDAETLRTRARVGTGDIAAFNPTDTLVSILAKLDQDELWTTAQRAEMTAARLKAETDKIGTTTEDAQLLEKMEKRHADFEAALRRHESIRHHNIFVGVATVIAAIPAAFMIKWVALAFLAVALLTTLVSISFRRRLEKARAAEQEVLDQAGVDSYLGYHLRRMDEMLDEPKARERISALAQQSREASEAWAALAGDISLEWVMSAHEEIKQKAHERSINVDSVTSSSEDATTTQMDPTKLAEALVFRLTELRHAGDQGESLPVILDDPLHNLDKAVKEWTLDLIARTAGSPQILYLTDDPDVAAWAHSKAEDKEVLGVIEPTKTEIVAN